MKTLKNKLLSLALLLGIFLTGNFTDSFASSVSGQITVGGNPVNLAIYDLYVVAWKIQGWGSGSVTQTDANGNFLIDSLDAGTYNVKATIFGKGFSYVEELWYDNTFAGNATPVVISNGQQITGIDFAFNGSSTIPNFGTVSGNVTVTDLNGVTSPANGIIVKAQTGGTTFDAPTDANGDYTINVADSGSFLISAEIDVNGTPMQIYWNNTSNVSLATSLLVTNGTATNGIDFNFDLANFSSNDGSVSGNISVGGNPVDLAIYDLYVVAWKIQGWGSGSVTQTDANGNFQIDSLEAGNYIAKATIFGKGFSFVEEIWYDGTYSANATPVFVNGGTQVSGIDFAFNGSTNIPNFGTVSGNVTITDSNGITSPANGVTVTAQNGGTNFDAPTDANGNYTINIADSGAFLISAEIDVNGTPMQLYWDNTTNVSSATPLLVTNGSATNGIDFNFDLSNASTTDGSITGTILIGGQPANTNLYDVQVFAWKNQGWGTSSTTQIDANGNFTLTGVEVGNYIVKAVIFGKGFTYVEELWYDNTFSANATPVFVNGGQQVSGIDFVFTGSQSPPTIQGWISGTVLDENSNPISGVEIEAVGDSSSFSATTNVNGLYVINLLDVGDFAVSAETVTNNGIPVKLFYDNSPNQFSATNVTVSQSNTTSGIDFDFDLSNTAIEGTLSGIINVNGSPIDTNYYDVQVHAISIGSFGGASTYTLGANGSYNFNLPAGNYIFKSVIFGKGFPILGELWYDGTYSANATKIWVNASQNISGIDFDFTGGNIPTGFGTISGNVSDSVGAISGAEIRLFPTSGFLTDTLKAFSDLNGDYTLNGVPTGINLKVGCFANNFETEYYDNQVDFFSADTVLISTANGTLSGIDFSLEPVNTIFSNNLVSGSVLSSNGTQIEDALIVIISANDLDAPLEMSTTLTGSNGTFSMPSLPTDEYYVFALANGHIPTFFGDVQDWNNSQKINVNGSTPNVNITLPQVENSSFGAISGTFGYNNGNSVAGIKDGVVYAVNSSGLVVGYDLTKTDGSYTISGLEEDNYYIYGTKIGVGTEFNFGAQIDENVTSLQNIDLVINGVTDVEETSPNQTITKFILHNNYPNPFNPSTTINYELKITNYEFGKLTIFNVLGKKVKEFSLTEPRGSVVWNGANELGNQVSSGVYFYRLEIGKQSQTKKMLLLK